MQGELSGKGSGRIKVRVGQRSAREMSGGGERHSRPYPSREGVRAFLGRGLQQPQFHLRGALAAVWGPGCVPLPVFMRMYQHVVCVSAHLESVHQVCCPQGLVFRFHPQALATQGLRGVAVLLLTHGWVP